MKWWRYIFDERLPGWCRLFPACLSCPAYCYGKKLHEKEILGYDREEETKKIIERISNAKGGIDMTQEDKELLLKDLCARLPYGVKIMFSNNFEQTLDAIQECDDGEYAVNGWGIHGIKPYLRPMKSMTEKEEEEFELFFSYGDHGWDNYTVQDEVPNIVDWYNAHHFDYRGLIEKGLALEAPKDMYNV